MWTYIVGGMLLFIAATFVIQMLFPRQWRSAAQRKKTAWDIAPVIAFFGLVLLGLALVEAVRRDVLIAWAAGSGLGLMVSLGGWVLFANRREMATVTKREPAWRTTLRILRTFGIPVLAMLVATYLVVRVFGSVVEVFLAGAFGVWLVALAVIVLAQNQKTVAGNSGR